MKLPGSPRFFARSPWLLIVSVLCCVALAPRAAAQLVGSGGLTGKYYNDTTFSSLVLTRVDPMIDFNWGRYAPISAISSANYSVRWTGMIQPRYTEPYHLSFPVHGTVIASAKVWINGVLVVEHPAVASGAGPVLLKAGHLYAIKVEWVHNTDPFGFNMSLRWESPSQSLEPVPSQYLYPTELTTSYTPIAYTAYQSGGGFTAEWAAVSGATGYRLDVSTDSAFGSFVSGYNNLSVGNVTEKAVTGLSSGKYYYRVRATWSGGTTASSNTVPVNVVAMTLISTQTYSSAGSATYTVPSGANRILVKLWGGGGRGSLADTYLSNGAGGGFVSGAYAVTANQTVNIYVGSPGGGATPAGGASAAWRVGGFQLIAGGGGSAGGPNDVEDAGGGDGGAGGFKGEAGHTGGNGGNNGGDGASRHGPGAGGYISTESGAPGSSGGGPMNLAGGASYVFNGGASSGGGDGGGGYYGGGGGAFRATSTQGGGGGGSNYLDLANGYVVGTGRTLSGQGVNTAAMTDSSYPVGTRAGLGAAVEYGSTGNPGYVVVLAYSVEVPPAISTQPTSVMVANAGDNTSFSVTASGFPAVTYQWKKNGTTISGATSSTLSLTNVQSGDVASYTVVVSNSWGSVTSTAATLSIDTPPGAPPWIGYLEKTDKTVTITWGAAADNVGISHYLVERGTSPTQIGTTTELVFTDVGLTANTAYLYQIKAVDTAGKTSAASSQLSVTTNASATADADGDGVPDSVETALGTVSSATNANATQVPNNIHRPRL